MGRAGVAFAATSGRTGLRARLALVVCALLGLSGCALSAGDGVDAVPPGAHLFARRPATADCRRVDLATLGRLTEEDQPAARPMLAPTDQAHPRLIWAGCVGLAPSADATDSSAARPGDTATQGAGDGGGGGGANASAAGPTGAVSWIVSWATSAAATTTTPFENPQVGEPDVRAVRRSTMLGDARADEVLAVHADDHQTTVTVTVYDPASDRDAAECGVATVPGDAADGTVTWCLDTLARLLLHESPPSPTYSGA